VPELTKTLGWSRFGGSFLREHPNMTIHLDGTTGDVGRLDYNLRLRRG
jgi:hypothetical protein